MSEQKLSPVEGIKIKSRGLRGQLAESLADQVTGALYDDEKNLIKFHGIYEQDDRDRRDERERKKLERAYSFMARLRIPGGDITGEQWLKLEKIAEKYTTGIIKITTRQTVQFHGIVKAFLKPTVQDFYDAGLDAIAACGDVNRNVMAGVYPQLSPFHAQVHKFADDISTHLLPKTNAFTEIWLDGEKLTGDEPEEDPLYLKHYLPRKFKVAIAIPPHNETDVFAHDIGLIAIEENGEFIGFNVSIGGGMGATHGNASTYPLRGVLIGFVPKEKTLDVVWQIAAIQRDHGNRVDRKLSRLKYTVERLGADWFKKEIETRSGVELTAVKPYRFTKRGDYYGWVKDYQSLNYYTVFVEHGRVMNKDGYNVAALLHDATIQKLCDIRFTANQNVMLTHIKDEDKDKIEALLQQHGVIIEDLTPVRADALACVALNTCPLAMAEAQRYLPTLITKIETIMDKHNLKNEQFHIRMTGCPNGCARPYLAEVGLIGKSLGVYNMHIGGDLYGERLNRLYKEDMDEKAILSELDTLFGRYKTEKQGDEGFGDFTNRVCF